jgi:hypothetical protein
VRGRARSWRPVPESDLFRKADKASPGAHRFFIDDRVDVGVLRGTGSVPLVGSLGDGDQRLWEFQPVSAAVHRPTAAEGVLPTIFHLYALGSTSTTTCGFGAAAITVFWSTFRRAPGNALLEK